MLKNQPSEFGSEKVMNFINDDKQNLKHDMLSKLQKIYNIYSNSTKQTLSYLLNYQKWKDSRRNIMKRKPNFKNNLTFFCKRKLQSNVTND